MTKNSKRWLMILVLIVALGFVIFLISQKNSNQTSDDSRALQNNLYPETDISHSHGLAVDVKDLNKLYIATHYGLMVLINEKNLYRVGKSKDDYMGFSPHPTEANTFFSSGHPSFGGNIGFQKSEDGGITWNKVSNGVNGPVDFHAMTVSPVNPALVYGWYRGNLQRSLNQGQTWEIVNREVVATYLAADSQNENMVYAATRDRGVMVSRDKAVTWTNLSGELDDGAVTVIAPHPKDAKIILAFSEKLGGLGKSTDSGLTWNKINEGFNEEIILHIAFARIDPNIVYVLTNRNTLYKSIDAGDTWIQIR